MMKLSKKTSRLWAVLLCALMLLSCTATALAATYTGYAQGFHGQVSVTLTVENGKITNAVVSDPNETQGIGSLAIEQAASKIIAAQGADIDMVAGATMTSKAVIEATKNAMKAAGLEVTVCKHENSEYTYNYSTSLNVGEKWTDTGDGKTHSAYGETWDYYRCYDCGETFEANYVNGLISRKHSYTNGRCYDCGYKCPHDKVTETKDDYDWIEGEEYIADSNGTTHTQLREYYDSYWCNTCYHSWKENVAQKPYTEKHLYDITGICYECGYACPHNFVSETFHITRLLDDENWKDDKNGLTHTGKCEICDIAYCKTCYYEWIDNYVVKNVTEYHRDNNKCSRCGSYNIINKDYYWGIDAQPKNVIVNIGDSVKTSVKIWKNDDSTSLTYQWYYKNPGDDAFKKSKLTGKTYSTTMTKEMDGRQIYCEITDAYGVTKTTEIAYIMLPELSITKQPKNITASAGEKISTSVTATGSGLKYQWYYRNSGTEEFKASKLTGNTYSTTMTQEMNGREVYCEITDANGEFVKTVIIMIKLPALKITTQPKDAWAYSGEKAKISVKASGDGLKYR